MTLLKKFDENGQEIGSPEDVPINETNFQQYIEQYGKERAEGYKDAFADIMKEISGMMTGSDKFGEFANSRQVIGRKVQIFHNEKSLTLEKLVQLLSDSKLQP
ncbi:hypothetical protein [Niastella populi]|uniref:Uncharacterized protein n=1 Tax=Niastella populi TaxID=550983 RepID=A0A1V9ET84_9BACT|nr:hypothetical protein [Niastella populi]OQP49065.1 hypothetical protein A4R26_31110 [Niastella populi]